MPSTQWRCRLATLNIELERKLSHAESQLIEKIEEKKSDVKEGCIYICCCERRLLHSLIWVKHQSPPQASLTMLLLPKAFLRLIFVSLTLPQLLACSVSTPPASQRPNFIFIITDDQDLHLSSLSYQPSVQHHFGTQGTFFSKHYATVALCCPSRVSLLTGKAAHNTNVTDVSAPYGE